MKVLKNIELDEMLFLDIETAAVVKELKIDSPLFEAWKYSNLKLGLDNEELIKLFNEKAALNPEFGKIICISIGRLYNGEYTSTSLTGDEADIINKLNAVLSKRKWKLTGHFIKTFDLPFIFKRSIINGIVPNSLVDVSGEKPWTMDWIIDTNELWGGYASLIALTTALGIDSPKDDIAGYQVSETYWENPTENISRISTYCNKDVEAVFKIMYRFKNISDVPTPKVEKGVLEALFEGNKYGPEEQKVLKELFEGATEEEEVVMVDILNAIVSTAKGKVTKLTKANIKQLQECKKKK